MTTNLIFKIVYYTDPTFTINHTGNNYENLLTCPCVYRLFKERTVIEFYYNVNVCVIWLFKFGLNKTLAPNLSYLINQ